MSQAQDFPHTVPPEAFMPWKENWFFVGVDVESRIATSIHWSLRPQTELGVLSAKFVVDGREFRYTNKAEIPKQLAGFHPVADERLSLEIVEEGARYRITYTSPELDADIRYTGRFDTFDFGDGVDNPGQSAYGESGRKVFPFEHQEQALDVEGTIVLHEEGGDRTLQVGGWASRDHSWGFRDDHTFVNHHWICASFPERFVQGTAMHESSYDGMKYGGFVSSAAGNVPVQSIDVTRTYWGTDDVEPLPRIDRDVTYVLRTSAGEEIEVVAEVGSDFGRLDLNFKSSDRTEAYEDRLIFCRFSIPATGEVGNGVLEVGKHLRGPAVADLRRPAAQVS